jgi:hypothetical protein
MAGKKRRIRLALSRGELGRSHRTRDIPGTVEQIRRLFMNPSRRKWISSDCHHTTRLISAAISHEP